MKRLFIVQPNDTPKYLKTKYEIEIGQKLSQLYPHENIQNITNDFSNDMLRDLGDSISRLSKADIIYFVNNWDTCPSCIILDIITKEYHGLDWHPLIVMPTKGESK